MRLPSIALLLFAVSLTTGCQLPGLTTRAQNDDLRLASFEQQAEKKTVYVIGHGWHTGLVLQTVDVSSEILPEINDFPNTKFVEIGWGDEGFYRAKKITAPLVAKAAFWPTPSVLHVAGFPTSVENVFEVSDIVEIQMTDEQFDRMCQFIGDSFARNEAGESLPLGPGIYGESAFYRGQSKYYVPKTCNYWTANALKKAGFPTVPQVATTAESILAQTRRFGRVVQKSPRGLKKAALQSRE